jgi:hypothetical protein
MEPMIMAKKYKESNKSGLLRWTCPNCGRQFQRRGQSHSCKLFNLKQHFEGKPQGKHLYQHLKKEIHEQIGPFKVESLHCCIHFVSIYTFAAVKIFKEKIQLEFGLTHKIKSSRITKVQKISTTTYLHFSSISTPQEIDEELLNWIKDAYYKK